MCCEALEGCLDRCFRFNVRSTEFKRICRHVLSFRPIHRCKADIFKSILNVKRLFSLAKLKGEDDPEPLAVVILEDKFIKWKLSEAVRNLARQYIDEYLKKGKEASYTSWGWYAWKIGQDKLESIDETFRFVQKWQEALKEQNPGIGFGGDVLMGLDDTVFSILGPHNTEYYGSIQLVFAPEVLQHPNSYVLPCAGTYFNDGGGQNFGGVGGAGPVVRRTWATSISKRKHEMQHLNEQQKQDNFVRNMLHCSVPDWWTVVAKELMARTAQWKSINVNSVTWENILAFNEACEGHAWLEALRRATESNTQINSARMFAIMQDSF